MGSGSGPLTLSVNQDPCTATLAVSRPVSRVTGQWVLVSDYGVSRALCARLSTRDLAGDFALAAGAVDAADWQAVGRSVAGHIEVDSFGGICGELRIR